MRNEAHCRASQPIRRGSAEQGRFPGPSTVTIERLRIDETQAYVERLESRDRSFALAIGAGFFLRERPSPPMLRILGNPKRLCDGITRRDLLQVGGAGFLGLSLTRLLEAKTV